MTFPPFYFETMFAVDSKDIVWPAEFAIITAFATTGEKWSDADNAAANARLLEMIRAQQPWHVPVTGFSPQDNHREPGWAVSCSLWDACRMGQQFRQHAIYFVRGDELTVCLCDDVMSETSVGPFRERVVSSGS